MTESGYQKLTEVVVFTDKFGEDDLLDICQSKLNKLIRLSPKKNIEIEKLKITSDTDIKKTKIDGIIKLATIQNGERFLKAILEV